MKTAYIIVLALLVISLTAFAATQIWNNQQMKKLEYQSYEVVEERPEFEIRYYPGAIIASVNGKGGTYREGSNNNFGRLAGYIFGGNETGEKIAMTSPVEMYADEKGSEMSFMMPSEYEMDDLPKPDDGGVRILRSEAEYVAAIRFGGYSSDEVIAEKTAELKVLLEKAGIAHDGQFRVLGYNPPYQVTNRRNEVIVRLTDWVAQ